MSNKGLMTVIKMNSLLGEGPVWHEQRGTWCWLDILSRKLFELKASKDINRGDIVEYDLDRFGSSIAVMEDGRLLIATNESLDVFDLAEVRQEQLLDLPYRTGFRSNEGGVGPDGYFWFSNMEWDPTGCNGSIYSVDSKMELSCQIENVGIPNTMIWDELEKKYYISDSLLGKTYCYNQGAIEGLEPPSVFLDLEGSGATPDGGAIDSNGNIWIALWGGGKVVCYEKTGILINEINLPVPQPTSCCFGGRNRKSLFITTAREGLTEADLNRFPLSGSVFIVELDVKGEKIPEFKLGNSYVS